MRQAGKEIRGNCCNGVPRNALKRVKSVQFWQKIVLNLRRQPANLKTCFQTQSSGRDRLLSQNLKQSGSESSNSGYENTGTSLGNPGIFSPGRGRQSLH